MNQTEFNPSYIGSRNDIISLVPEDAKSILDVGCSIGTLGAKIKDSFPAAEVVGIELDEEMAYHALEKIDKVLIGNVEDIELADHFEQGTFDCIIFADVLEHLRDPWRVLREFVLYLRSEGTVIASLPNIRHYDSIYNLVFKGHWPYRDRGIHDRTHLRFFTKKNIIELFNGAELQITKIIPHYRIIEKPYGLNRISKIFAVRPLRDFLAFQYLVVARFKNV